MKSPVLLWKAQVLVDYGSVGIFAPNKRLLFYCITVSNDSIKHHPKGKKTTENLFSIIISQRFAAFELLQAFKIWTA